MKKNVKYILCIIISIIFLTGCSANSNKPDDISKKIVAEIEFIDSKIIDMLNNLNNISFQNYRLTSKKVEVSKESENAEETGGETKNSSDNANSQSEEKTKNSPTSIETTEMIAENILTNSRDDIDWKLIKTEIELLNTSWSVTLYDIYKKNNSDNTDLLAFSDTLDKCILSIKENNKKDSIANLANLYSYMPKFIEIASDDKKVKNIKEIKSKLINSYAALENDDWTLVQDNLSLAETSFAKLFEDLEYVKQNEYKMNKSFILLKELQNSTKENDKEIFYMKYINLMESLNTLK